MKWKNRVVIVLVIPECQVVDQLALERREELLHMAL
jgi:hypothetical protein